MPFPTPEKISEKEFEIALNTLHKTLSQLPKQIPFKDARNTAFKQFFPPFILDQDYFNKTEDEVVTIGEMLEHVFGWKSWTTGDGTLPIQERGPGLLAVHAILKEYYGKYRSNVVLKKWVLDILDGVEKVFQTYQVPVLWNAHESELKLTA
jgi:hypothetical protein